MPFITLYTVGVADANYYRSMIAIIMAVTTAIEMVHIPSGHMINMSGNFKIAKNIQVFSCAFLLITMALGGMYYGIYGMLLAVLFTALLLAVLEICYIHRLYFHNKLYYMLRMLAPLIILSIPLCILEQRVAEISNTPFLFIFCGAIFVIVNFVIAICTGLLFCKHEICSIWGRFYILINQLLMRK